MGKNGKVKKNKYSEIKHLVIQNSQEVQGNKEFQHLIENWDTYSPEISQFHGNTKLLIGESLVFVLNKKKVIPKPKKHSLTKTMKLRLLNH